MPTEQSVFETIESINLPPDRFISLTIGTFDGVHQAHQKLIRDAVGGIREKNGLAVVLSFRNHPRSVVTPDLVPKLLTPWEVKRQLLLDLGIDALIGLKFTPELMAVEAEDFLRWVVRDRIHANFVSCGPAFHFGKGGRGNAQLLKEMSGELGYTFCPHDPVLDEDEKISSTRIRASLTEGNVSEAARLLSRPHRNQGVVVTGDKLGRTIGFPTANLRIDNDYQLPADGVYAVRVTLPDGQRFPGMMNLGMRPTVSGKEHRREVHLIGFEGELVGQELKVDYIERLRSEVKFDGIEALKAQLAKDRESALAAL